MSSFRHNWLNACEFSVRWFLKLDLTFLQILDKKFVTYGGGGGQKTLLQIFIYEIDFDDPKPHQPMRQRSRSSASLTWHIGSRYWFICIHSSHWRVACYDITARNLLTIILDFGASCAGLFLLSFKFIFFVFFYWLLCIIIIDYWYWINSWCYIREYAWKLILLPDDIFEFYLSEMFTFQFFRVSCAFPCQIQCPLRIYYVPPVIDSSSISVRRRRFWLPYCLGRLKKILINKKVRLLIYSGFGWPK